MCRCRCCRRGQMHIVSYFIGGFRGSLKGTHFGGGSNNANLSILACHEGFQLCTSEVFEWTKKLKERGFHKTWGGRTLLKPIREVGLLWQQLGFFAIWDLKKGGGFQAFLKTTSTLDGERGEEKKRPTKSRLFVKDWAEIPFDFQKDEWNVVNSTRFYWVFCRCLVTSGSKWIFNPYNKSVVSPVDIGHKPTH